MNSNKLVMACLVGLGIAGCSETVIAAPPVKELHKHLIPASSAPALCDPRAADMLQKYGPARELVHVPVQFPKGAKDGHSEGDVGAEFQLDATGTPRNIRIVCEKPAGFGLGEALVSALKQEKFQPMPSPFLTTPLPDQWHYTSASFRFDKPPPKH